LSAVQGGDTSLDGEAPLVVVTVGTDHHPFNRLIQWIDVWLEAQEEGTIQCVVQRGTSVVPRHASWSDYLDRDAMDGLLRKAAVVVCHGGPGTITLACASGRRPIVVPRTRSRGEHVDDHQVAFTRRISKEGMIELAETEEQLHASLDEALQDGARAAAPDRSKLVETTVRQFEALVDGLVDGSPQPSEAPGSAVNGNTDPVPVLYIAGLGRSGSTLLDLLLGQTPHLTSVGELRFVWQRGLGGNELCGCGARFHECEFWRRVGEEAFGGWDQVDLDAMIALDDGLDRHRYLLFLLFPKLWPDFGRRLRSYAEALSRLYRAIHTVAGGSVLVDSTKDPPFAFLLRHVDAIDLRIIHLVRDSRGVAYSWTKRISKPERVDRPELMNVYDPVNTSLRWLSYNLLTQVLARLGVPRVFVRYESFIEAPKEHLVRVAALGGVELRPEDLAFLDQDSAQLEAQHTVAGNPMRFSQGRISLRLDDAWRTKLSGRDQRRIAMLTWPLLWRYGYRPARRSRR
jgi:UDP-N-acetylglucosamine transferase subunit ALG13